MEADVCFFTLPLPEAIEATMFRFFSPSSQSFLLFGDACWVIYLFVVNVTLDLTRIEACQGSSGSLLLLTEFVLHFCTAHRIHCINLPTKKNKKL